LPTPFEWLSYILARYRRRPTLGFRVRSVLLADPDRTVMRFDKTFVRHATESPKSEAGQRT
jgi:hypothetical protein